MWWLGTGVERARRTAAQKAPAGIMRDFLAAPVPSRQALCRHVEIAALDLETTGLEPKQDRILSIGLVMVRGLIIDLFDAWQESLSVNGKLPEQTVVIHGITDDQAALGSNMDEVLPTLLQLLTGKVLLVHNASLDRAFLDKACRDHYGAPFIMPIIDTQELARRRFERRNLPVKSGDLRLFSLRQRYNLPRYNAHNALSDALATAELFLAMAAEISPTGDSRLREVITR